ncbi:hypothetical protein [Bradyrhizobium sp. URHC0002]
MALTVKGIKKLTKAERYRDAKNLYLQITRAAGDRWQQGWGPGADISLRRDRVLRRHLEGAGTGGRASIANHNLGRVCQYSWCQKPTTT